MRVHSPTPFLIVLIINLEGFGYKWCTAIRFEDLVAKKSFTIKCPHSDAKEAAFRFQAWVQTDTKDAIKLVPSFHTKTLSLMSIPFIFSKSPKVTLRLRAPIELENLLPYNLQYRIYDKDADQNWKSYLRKGGIMPVHSVELGHLVLLNVEVQDTGKPLYSNFTLGTHLLQCSNQAILPLLTLMGAPILISRTS